MHFRGQDTTYTYKYNFIKDAGLLVMGSETSSER